MTTEQQRIEAKLRDAERRGEKGVIVPTRDLRAVFPPVTPATTNADLRAAIDITRRYAALVTNQGGQR